MTTATPAMAPADITRIRWVSDPRISADGRRVAFVVTVLPEERDEHFSTIWLVGADGGEARCFTTGPGRDTAPRWSLAFLSEREGKAKPQLHVMLGRGILLAVEDGGRLRRHRVAAEGSAPGVPVLERGGSVMRPAGAGSTQRAPVRLGIHGGPHAQCSPPASSQHQSARNPA